MVRTQDTSPPGRDHTLNHGPNWHRDAGLMQGIPDTVQPLKPGDQYLDPRTGCITKVLSERQQREHDDAARARLRAQMAEGIAAERRALATVREEIAQSRATLDQAAAALKALRPLREHEKNDWEIARRHQVRLAWVNAARAHESHLAAEQATLAGIAQMVAALKAT